LLAVGRPLEARGAVPARLVPAHPPVVQAALARQARHCRRRSDLEELAPVAAVVALFAPLP